MHCDRIVIVGAAGRDVHTFNVLYRDDPSVHVVAFTTSRLPAGRIASLPMALAGPRYPNGVPFVPMQHRLVGAIAGSPDSVVYVDSNVLLSVPPLIRMPPPCWLAFCRSRSTSSALTS